MTPFEALIKLKNRGWTVSGIAREVSADKANISRAMAGKSNPTYDLAVRILKLARTNKKPRGRGK